MKKLYLFCLFTIISFSLSCCGTANGNSNNSSDISSASSSLQISENTEESVSSINSEKSDTNILVAYFSATGTTKPIAETIANITGADLYEIIPSQLYTNEDLNYKNDNCRANQEQNNSSFRTEIEGSIANMNDYDIVFIGHPIWWGEEPRIIDTFVESYDLSGKTIIDFCTSGGSDISISEKNLKELCPSDVTWLKGKRFKSNTNSDEISEWINSLNIETK